MTRNGAFSLCLGLALLGGPSLLVADQHGNSDGGEAGAKEIQGANATLRNAEDAKVGHVVLEPGAGGVLLRAQFSGLPAGTHAFHIHETGKCDPPFKSAGGHYAPHGKKHGLLSPGGAHAGDLPNISVPESGELEIDVFVSGLRLSRGEGQIFDEDGSAFVIHEGADDYATDPAGAAGPRIACGVIETGSGAVREQKAADPGVAP